MGEVSSKHEDNVPAVHEAALAALEELNKLPMNPSAKSGIPYQPFRTKRPVRHDVLIIIDGTGSMAGEIDNLRTSFGEVIDKYAEGLDLRLDVWSLGDYTTHAGMPIIPLGARMRHKTFRDIAKEIKADRGQTRVRLRRMKSRSSTHTLATMCPSQPLGNREPMPTEQSSSWATPTHMGGLHERTTNGAR